MKSIVVLEDVLCPLGCYADDETVLTGRDLLQGLPGKFKVVRCRKCKLLRTTPRPTPDTIGFYYPEEYGPYKRQAEPSRDETVAHSSRALKRFMHRVLQLNTHRLPDLAPGRLLEIGCASGGFLRRMFLKGWDVEGLEFSEAAARKASEHGFHVYAGSLESAPDPREKFDLIVGWMVLEHLHDPVQGLQKLGRWGNPGAWLVLSVPNAGSRAFQLFKSNWYDLHLPNHLFHFTPATVAQTLQAGGWRLERIHHQRVVANLGMSVAYAARERGYGRVASVIASAITGSGKLIYLLYPVAWLLGLLGQTGRMTVWARLK